MKSALVETAAGAARLAVLGGFHPEPGEGLGQTLLLLGPGPDFWHHFSQCPEYRDGLPDPLDRWSRRVVTRLAEIVGATPLFPFEGPPYHPFYSWAERTGRAWPSPVSLLVHAGQGLWLSFRGALVFEEALDLPTAQEPPCETCPDQPCRTACPAGALTNEGCDVSACKAWLNRPEGAECMTYGCAVRRACPVSRGFPRAPQQSAFHMEAFR